MKTALDIRTLLDEYFSANYYAEDYEVQWKVKNLRDELASSERSTFDGVILDRLLDDPSVLNVTICTKLQIPEAIPILCDLLNQEERTSQRSRTIMYALQNYEDAKAYEAIERFLDSEQEREALHILCGIDFERSKTHFLRQMYKRGWEGECLHILGKQKSKQGIEDLLAQLLVWGEPNKSRFRRRLRHIFASLKGKYNPFSDDEIRHILNAFPRFG